MNPELHAWIHDGDVVFHPRVGDFQELSSDRYVIIVFDQGWNSSWEQSAEQDEDQPLPHSIAVQPPVDVVVSVPPNRQNQPGLQGFLLANGAIISQVPRLIAELLVSNVANTVPARASMTGANTEDTSQRGEGHKSKKRSAPPRRPRDLRAKSDINKGRGGKRGGSGGITASLVQQLVCREGVACKWSDWYSKVE